MEEVKHFTYSTTRTYRSMIDTCDITTTRQAKQPHLGFFPIVAATGPVVARCGLLATMKPRCVDILTELISRPRRNKESQDQFSKHISNVVGSRRLVREIKISLSPRTCNPPKGLKIEIEGDIIALKRWNYLD